MVHEEGIYKGNPHMLLIIDKNPGMSQAQIAKKLDIKPASATVMIKRMEAAGLIERRKDENDQRTLRVYATPGGRQMAEKTVDTFDRYADFLYGVLDKGELEQYYGLIEKIYKNIAEKTNEMDGETDDQII